MVPLEGARRFGLVKDAGARADELLVKLALMIAAVPPLAIQRVQGAPALVDAIERAHAARHLAALVELLHRRKRALGLGRSMQRVVHGVHGLIRKEGHAIQRALCSSAYGQD